MVFIILSVIPHITEKPNPEAKQKKIKPPALYMYKRQRKSCYIENMESIKAPSSNPFTHPSAIVSTKRSSIIKDTTQRIFSPTPPGRRGRRSEKETGRSTRYEGRGEKTQRK